MSKGRMILIVVGALVVAFLALAYLSGQSPRRIPAWSVRYEGGIILVRSSESNTYQQCDLELNDRYVLTGQSILYYKENSFRMAEFADSQGARFNIRATKPVAFYIRCRWPDELSDAYRFN